MSMLTFDLRADELMAQLRSYPERVASSVVKAMNRCTILVQAHVKTNKLTGQVLHVRTGTLRRSINREVRASGQTGMIEGIVGTNVSYAAVHEYGFSGTVSVREYVRRVKAGGRAAMGLGRRAKGTAGVTTVRAHSRSVNVPERSFLRSALKDCTPVINLEFQRALLESWKR